MADEGKVTITHLVTSPDGTSHESHKTVQPKDVQDDLAKIGVYQDKDGNYVDKDGKPLKQKDGSDYDDDEALRDLAKQMPDKYGDQEKGREIGLKMLSSINAGLVANPSPVKISLQ